MLDKVKRKLDLSFIHLHVLYHASKAPFYGVWMIDELKTHGYQFGPSTIYPLLKEMTDSELLEVNNRVVLGKLRKYYVITDQGLELLRESIHQVKVLLGEIGEEQHEKNI